MRPAKSVDKNSVLENHENSRWPPRRKKGSPHRGGNGSPSRITGIFLSRLCRRVRKRLSHIKEAGFIEVIRGRLGKFEAFRRISTVVDGRKWRHISLPDAAVKSASQYWFPYISLTKLLKNEVPGLDVAASGGLRRRCCWNPGNICSSRLIAFGLRERWLPRTSRPCLRLQPRGKSGRWKLNVGKSAIADCANPSRTLFHFDFHPSR